MVCIAANRNTEPFPRLDPGLLSELLGARSELVLLIRPSGLLCRVMKMFPRRHIPYRVSHAGARQCHPSVRKGQGSLKIGISYVFSYSVYGVNKDILAFALPLNTLGVFKKDYHRRVERISHNHIVCDNRLIGGSGDSIFLSLRTAARGVVGAVTSRTLGLENALVCEVSWLSKLGTYD